MTKRRKTNVKLPKEKENHFMKMVREDADEAISRIGELDIEQEDKDYLCETVEDLCNMTMALLKRTNLPKRGLPYPWSDDSMN